MAAGPAVSGGMSDPGGGPSPSPTSEREMRLLAAELRAALRGWEGPLEAAQRLLVWERPVQSAGSAAALTGGLWLFSSTSLRPLFLLSVSLLGVLVLERWKPRFLTDFTVQAVEEPGAEGDGLAAGGAGHPRLLSVPELCLCLAESWVTFRLYLQEVLQYKRQNPGKFCASVCACCLSLSVVGHYVPGIMISYIILLSVLLWPLVVYRELIQKLYTGLEPILMKLDYTMKGETQHHKHEKRKKETKKEPEDGDAPMVETDSESEAELAGFSPLIDVKTTALALAITDSELSDEEASILESGGFSVSRATTPQLTDVSEDLDRQSLHSDPEESFSRDLADFPSVEEYHSRDQRAPGEEEAFGGLSEVVQAKHELDSLQSAENSELAILRLASPLHFVNTHFNGNGEQVSAPLQTSEVPNLDMTLQALSEEIVTTAITTVVQNTLSALLRSSEASEGPSISEFLPAKTGEDLTLQVELAESEEVEDVPVAEEDAEDTDDFELLDQTELEQMHRELGLGGPEGDQEMPTGVSPDTPISFSSSSPTSTPSPNELPKHELPEGGDGDS
ncbi:reticulophagy regulator 2 [Ambystoma mexicanum]|uniref:reticulophagy regulator 2 n=1 Tax=Ambystoma mexicanum TaxID=8296 RepID=UPI0037E7347B